MSEVKHQREFMTTSLLIGYVSIVMNEKLNNLTEKFAKLGQTAKILKRFLMKKITKPS